MVHQLQMLMVPLLGMRMGLHLRLVMIMKPVVMTIMTTELMTVELQLLMPMALLLEITMEHLRLQMTAMVLLPQESMVLQQMTAILQVLLMILLTTVVTMNMTFHLMPMKLQKHQLLPMKSPGEAAVDLEVHAKLLQEFRVPGVEEPGPLVEARATLVDPHQLEDQHPSLKHPEVAETLDLSNRIVAHSNKEVDAHLLSLSLSLTEVQPVTALPLVMLNFILKCLSIRSRFQCAVLSTEQSLSSHIPYFQSSQLFLP